MTLYCGSHTNMAEINQTWLPRKIPIGMVMDTRTHTHTAIQRGPHELNDLQTLEFV